MSLFLQRAYSSNSSIGCNVYQIRAPVEAPLPSEHYRGACTHKEAILR